MLAEINAAMAALGGVRDISRGLLAVRDIAELGTIKIDLQAKVIDLQSAMMEVQSKLEALQIENAQLRARHDVRDRYRLAEVVTGSFAYRLKDELVSTEPSHFVCQACLDAGTKAVLRQQGGGYSATVLSCPACGQSITTAPPTRRPQPDGGPMSY
jgi:hypothetical protein